MEPTPIFRVSPASPLDIDDMTKILISAMEYEIIIRFMFGHQHRESLRLQTEFFTSLWKAAFQNKAAHVIKATLNSTGETIGFGLVRWADGKWEKSTAPPTRRPDPADVSFLDYYGAEVAHNYQQLMAGKEHYGKIFSAPRVNLIIDRVHE